MKFSEIEHLEKSELRQKLHQRRRELFDSRMKLKMQRLSNPLLIRFLRRDIARLQTALSAGKAAVKKKAVGRGKTAPEEPEQKALN